LWSLACKELGEAEEKTVFKALEEVIVYFSNLVRLHEDLAYDRHHNLYLFQEGLSNLAIRVVKLVTEERLHALTETMCLHKIYELLQVGVTVDLRAGKNVVGTLFK